MTAQDDLFRRVENIERDYVTMRQKMHDLNNNLAKQSTEIEVLRSKVDALPTQESHTNLRLDVARLSVTFKIVGTVITFVVPFLSALVMRLFDAIGK